jgi:hypothetical protein
MSLNMHLINDDGALRVAWYTPGCTIGGKGCAPRTVSDLTLLPPGFAELGRTDLRQLSVPAWLYAGPI